jgi:hypothetical protein
VPRDGVREIRVEAEAAAALDDAVYRLPERDGAPLVDRAQRQRVQFRGGGERLGSESLHAVALEHLVMRERKRVGRERPDQFDRVLVLGVQVVRRWLDVVTADRETPRPKNASPPITTSYAES